MSRECQHCGLLSPDEALRCDCGYDFRSRTVERSYLVSRVPEKAGAIDAFVDSLRTSTGIGVFLQAIFALVAVVGWHEQGEHTFYAGPLLWICWLLYRAGRDSRAREELTPSPEDVFGAFQVQGGLIVPGSYRRNPAHRLLSDKGLFQLEYAVRERLKAEIATEQAFREAGPVASEHVM